jgi:hypothetical protein
VYNGWLIQETEFRNILYLIKLWRVHFVYLVGSDSADLVE